jgi:hypothetical protein
MRIVLAEREADLMEVLWDHGPSTVAEVRKRLKVRLAYNTVLSILRTRSRPSKCAAAALGKALQRVCRTRDEQPGRRPETV